MRGALGIAALGTGVIAAFAVGIPLAAARLRPPSELAALALSYQPKYRVDQRAGTCFLHSGFDDVALFRKDLCLDIVPGRKNFLVMGDSHAANFAAAIAGRRPDIHVLQATASGCEATLHGTGAKRCTKLFEYVFNEFLPAHHLDAIVLAGRWPGASLQPLERTIPYIRPFADRIVVFGPIVEYDQPFPRLLARSITENAADLPAQHLQPKQRTADRRYAARVTRAGAEYYSVYDATCPKDACTLWAAPGVPMQYDEHHLTEPGSNLVMDRFGPALFPN